MKKKLLILIPSYNVEKFLHSLLVSIPSKKLKKFDVEVLIINDASNDKTLNIAEKYKAKNKNSLKITILSNKENQGYGDVQKIGYKYALKNNFDLVVLLPGDGQYNPKKIPFLIEPIVKKKADVVLGSRMLNKNNALKGGMPFLRFIGNFFLNKIQNLFLSANISEYHTGYRVYSINTLKRIPFYLNSHSFHFDTQIIIQILFAKMKIKELPIETIYGEQKSYLKVIPYVFNVLKNTLLASVQRLGILYEKKFDLRHHQDNKVIYQSKLHFHSSHKVILENIKNGEKVLNLGLNFKDFENELKKKKCEIINFDLNSYLKNVEIGEHGFIDPEKNLFPFKNEDFDKVIIISEIQRLKNPEALIFILSNWFSNLPKLKIYVTTTNIGFFLIRGMLLLGFFNHSARGILDMSITRNFTFSSLKKIFEQNGFQILRMKGIPAPYPLAIKNKLISKILLKINQLMILISKSFFSYEIFAELKLKKSVEQLINEARKK